MSYTLSEKKVLKKLGIKDFRHMTKDKLVQFASMLPKMDPEVAKAALSQFPSFSGLAKDLTEQLSIMVGREFDLSSDSQKAFFDAGNRILTSLEKELEDDDIDSDERNRIEDKMIQVAQMLDKKDTDNKKRAEHVTEIVAGICGVIVLAAAAILGAASLVQGDDSSDPSDDGIADCTDNDGDDIIEGDYSDITDTSEE